MTDKTLGELFYTALKDVYYAEHQILKVMPKMAQATLSQPLRDAFYHHRDQSQTHIERLQHVFEIIGRPPGGRPCAAIDGIIAEGEAMLLAFDGTPALDAGLIGAARTIGHYEMARYGVLHEWAGQLGSGPAMARLALTLDEEGRADALLGRIARRRANRLAL